MLQGHPRLHPRAARLLRQVRIRGEGGSDGRLLLIHRFISDGRGTQIADTPVVEFHLEFVISAQCTYLNFVL
uniref:Glucosamine 6-phosphate N-acetyltransferase n=1 Tax=Arundo donax TaxID=35708 RepID=A0A0A9GI53_ARUDO